MNKIHSTLGFLFTKDFSQVLLIEKQKPAFHKDKLNGLGGKFELGETATECIVREVEEETSLQTQEKDWLTLGSLEWDEWHVEIMSAVYQGEIKVLRNSGEEHIGWYPVNNLPEKVITNLPWLIPMCVDVLRNGSEFKVHIEY